MSVVANDTVTGLRRTIAELRQQLGECRAELNEAVKQQSATADELQVINQTRGDLAPVFEAVLDKALGLCGAAFGILRTYDGARLHVAALRGVPPAYAEHLRRAPPSVGLAPDNALVRLLRGEPVVHIADAAEDTAYLSGDPLRRAVVDLGRARTLLGVPLRRNNALLGAFVIYRQEVRLFSDKQIALLQNFAAQAAIAMENARLLTEQRARTAQVDNGAAQWVPRQVRLCPPQRRRYAPRTRHAADGQVHCLVRVRPKAALASSAPHRPAAPHGTRPHAVARHHRFEECRRRPRTVPTP